MPQEKNRLWLLEAIEPGGRAWTGQTRVVKMVVRASDQREARDLASKETRFPSGREIAPGKHALEEPTENPWTNYKATTCYPLRPEGQPEIIAIEGPGTRRPE